MVSNDYFLFFCNFVGAQIRRYADTQIGVHVMTSNQLPEVVVGFAGSPHPWRISKLSRKYWCDKHQLKQESTPVIPVNTNHPAASAACKRIPSAAVRKSPPRAAEARANNALMHRASASAPRCHDVASVAASSVATDAGNAAGLAAAHAVSAAALAAAAGSMASSVCSVNSSNSSNSEDFDMIGGGLLIPRPVLPVGTIMILQRMGMILTTICSLMQKQVSTRFWIISSLTWSRR